MATRSHISYSFINDNSLRNTKNVSNILTCTIIFISVATLSVISGIKIGIRRLSEICFGLGRYRTGGILGW